MVPIWSELLPCSLHSADQKIDHSGRRLRKKITPGQLDHLPAETLGFLQILRSGIRWGNTREQCRPLPPAIPQHRNKG